MNTQQSIQNFQNLATCPRLKLMDEQLVSSLGDGSTTIGSVSLNGGGTNATKHQHGYGTQELAMPSA
jgi:hypothetical protein